MLQMLAALNPATGTSLFDNPWLIVVFIVSGVVVIGGVVFAILSKKSGNKKGGKKGGKRR